MDLALSVIGREAPEMVETPFGAVGTLYASSDLKAWWIWKDEEDVDPAWKVNSHDDFLYVVRGELKLELRGKATVMLQEGDAFVIPAGAPFRGYRWPRTASEPCLFLAVSPGDQTTTEQPG